MFQIAVSSSFMVLFAAKNGIWPESCHLFGRQKIFPVFWALGAVFAGSRVRKQNFAFKERTDENDYFAPAQHDSKRAERF